MENGLFFTVQRSRLACVFWHTQTDDFSTSLSPAEHEQHDKREAHGGHRQVREDSRVALKLMVAFGFADQFARASAVVMRW